MSKVNAMQAIREARYAARASATSAVVTNRAVPKPEPDAVVTIGPKGPDATVGVEPNDQLFAAEPVEPVVAAEPVRTEAAEALCGHRSMNNRICKRPAGHAEKNHRYN